MKKQILSTLMLLACFGVSGQVYAASALTLNDITPTAGSSATKTAGILQLTDNSLADPTYQVGSAYSSSTVNLSSFNAAFSFKFSGSGTYGSADGLVFVIKNPGSKTSGGNGGGLGYGTITTGSGSYTGIPNSVGIEFDNWVNYEVGDPSGNHIGIDTNGNVQSLATANVSPSFNGTGVWYAWVDYSGSNLSVSVNQTGVKPGAAMLTYNIGSLDPIIGSSGAVIGFTGSTGGATQTAQVLSLNFQTSPGSPAAVPEPGSLALIGVGGALAMGRKNIMRRRKAC
jgi:hypothetical protein